MTNTIEIREFVDTVDAVYFGMQATEQQMARMKQLKEQGEEEFVTLMEQAKKTKDRTLSDKALKLAVRIQLLRESIEWKEIENILITL